MTVDQRQTSDADRSSPDPVDGAPDTVPSLADQLGGALVRSGLSCPVLANYDREQGDGAPLVVALARWSPALLTRLGDRVARAGATVLPVRLDGGTALVGPLLDSGGRSCPGCLETARLAAVGGRTPHDDPGLQLGGLLAPALLPLLAAMIRSALAAPDTAAATLWIIRPDSSVTAHPVVSVGPRCGTCVARQPPAPPGTSLARGGRPLPDPFRLRQPNPATSREGLRRELLDRRLGPVVRLDRHEGLGLPVAVAELAAPGTAVAGFGRATTFAEAERLALFEAVERLAGHAPTDGTARRWATFQDLGPDRAVDPATLGLPDHPSTHHTRYAPDVATHWVAGWSPSRQAAVAVPEHVAYWGAIRRRIRPSVTFLSESSNGCGVGNSIEEAALYGLFEVIERDAFLMAWYARTPLVEVELPAELALPVQLADDLDVLGYELRLFDATNDLAVPAVVAVARHRSPGTSAPVAFFSAGAHLDPRSAIHSAVVEVAVNVHEVLGSWRGGSARVDRARLLPMLDEPTLVHALDDHMMVHCLPEAQPRYEFLLAGAPTRTWREVWPGRPRPVNDLTTLLGGLCADLHRAGLDPVVVDQTIPALRERLGLYAAKVVVPGTLPMTFGHLNRRTRGLPRLLTVPGDLGRLPGPLCHEDLPLHPHPFP
ncbi:TOMM precursor leader peptide-binding protein [Micromonospora sp. LOL_024]|uniref:TOMM precursor leader peptide-binding protein n=1 Tax=Micromonospora sp. LOL_024 TaxID=3345412 RepID=UPI003A88BA57